MGIAGSVWPWEKPHARVYPASDIIPTASGAQYPRPPHKTCTLLHLRRVSLCFLSAIQNVPCFSSVSPSFFFTSFAFKRTNMSAVIHVDGGPFRPNISTVTLTEKSTVNPPDRAVC